MRIAVVGSWNAPDGYRRDRSAELFPCRATHDEFVVACRAIGRELAARPHVVVIVGSRRHAAADTHVVDAMLEAFDQGASRTMIEVVRPGDADEYRELEARHRGAIGLSRKRQRTWGDAHLMQVKRAQAVLTIGGGPKTWAAGTAAIVAGKPLVPVASFGGASEPLLEAVGNLDEREDAELDALGGAWGEHVMRIALRRLGVDRKRRILIVHGHDRDRLALKQLVERRHADVECVMMRDRYESGVALHQEFERLASSADAAIVLATPDDMGCVKGGVPEPRARQNVWLEFGWMWGKLGLERVMVLQKQELEQPSDIDGLKHARYEDALAEAEPHIERFVASIPR